MNSSTRVSASHAHFENAVGRLSVHPAGHYIAIEYHRGPRRAQELHIFLNQAGKLLARWGWDKLLTTQESMPDFTREEEEEMSAYWLTRSPQQPDTLHGALLLPHKIFARLSWKASDTGNVVFRGN